jgi:alcohol dehydrogenase
MLLRMAAADRLPTESLVTHTFPLEHMEEAYDVFARAADTGALKVVLGGQRHDTLAVPTA